MFIFILVRSSFYEKHFSQQLYICWLQIRGMCVCSTFIRTIDIDYYE